MKYLCLFTFLKYTTLNLKKYLSSRHRNQTYNFSNFSNCLTFPTTYLYQKQSNKKTQNRKKQLTTKRESNSFF